VGVSRVGFGSHLVRKVRGEAPRHDAVLAHLRQLKVGGWRLEVGG
jgi:hypothetical protein